MVSSAAKLGSVTTFCVQGNKPWVSTGENLLQYYLSSRFRGRLFEGRHEHVA